LVEAENMRYVPALDGIRAIAILMVVIFHARTRTAGLPGGFLGVDVFFVLSGYLITRLLVDEHQQTGSIRLSRFYLRRARRLYPALLLMLAVYLVVASHFFPAIPMRSHWRDAAVSALYLSDYAGAFYEIPLRIGYTWTLAVEEHFYLVWPLFLLLLLKLPRKAAIASMLGLFVAATAWRWGSLQLFERWEFTYIRFDSRMSGLMLGSAIGLWRPNIRYPMVASMLGLCGLVAVGLTQRYGTDVGLVRGVLLAEVSSVFLILGASSLPFLAWPALIWLGRMSYGWYLWHYLVMRMVRFWGMHDFWQLLLIGGGGGLLCAAVSYYTIEKLFRVQRKKPPISETVAAQPLPASADRLA
jgi:peptidoglycan/LPS O-acetylase OafA/YrhL